MTLSEYLNSLKGKKIAVLGYGISNRPLVKLLAGAGLDVTVRDKGALPEIPGVKCISGESYLDELTEDVERALSQEPNACPLAPMILERIEQFRRDRVFRMDLGVGVQNAIDRVELLYSGQGSVMLAARDGGGTLVKIDLPALHRRETEHTTEAKA